MNYVRDKTWDWLMTDSLYAGINGYTFLIDEKSDTIFMDCVSSDDRRNVGIWNRNNYLSFGKERLEMNVEFRLNSKYKGEEWYDKLLRKWDIDSLRNLRANTSPVIKHFVHRIIIYDGHIKIDTAQFFQPGTPWELLNDDERAAQEKYEANIQKWEEEKRRVMAKLEQERKDASKSIWRRIVDWFSNLWHSIFG